MPSSFLGLEIASRAMAASQGAINVVGHNLANVNTSGYSRQQARIVASEPSSLPSAISIGAGQIGQGAELLGIERVYDPLVDKRLKDTMADQGMTEKMRDMLSRVEQVFGEPGDGGLNNLLTQFFNSFQELSRTPESSGLRATLVQQTKSMTSRFNEISIALDDVSAHIQDQVRTTVDQVNRMASEVAGLNKRIIQAVADGEQPNDLQDSRDELVKKIGELVGVDIKAERNNFGQPNGAVSLIIGDTPVVLGTKSYELPLEFKTLGHTAYLTNGKDDIPIQTGAVAGYVAAFNLAGVYKDKMNTVASALITQVNAQHAAGYGLDNGTGRPFFAGNDAGNIAIDTAIVDDVRTIAASSPPAPPATEIAPGNGDNARGIADISKAPLIGSFTIGGYYANSVAEIGADVKAQTDKSVSQAQMISQIKSMRESISGVSMDEELTHMLQYQRSYQAAARLVTVFDGMLDTVINRMGA